MAVKFFPIDNVQQYKNIGQEYARAQVIEKRYKNINHITTNNAQLLLTEVGIKNKARFWIVDGGCASYYAGMRGKDKKGDIILLSWHNKSSVIIHELAHMVVDIERLKAQDGTSKHHGADYLWVLGMLFNAAKKVG